MSDTIADEKFVELNYKVIDTKTGDVLVTVDYPLGYEKDKVRIFGATLF